jgi:hypothetical protein
MAYSSIPASKREVGKPIDKDLVDNIHDNLEDLNERVNSISLAAGSNIIINEIVKKPKDTLPIGTLIHASMVTADFQAEVDDGEWVLADGSSAAGSDWATLTGRTTLPDARGRFLRGKDNAAGNNSDGDKSLDSYTADTVVSHTHTMTHSHTFSGTTSSENSHAHEMFHNSNSTDALASYFPTPGNKHFPAYKQSFTGANGDNTYEISGSATAPNLGSTSFTPAHSHTFSGTTSTHSSSTGSTGSNETAPRYVTENIFMKINRAYIKTNARLFVARMAQQTTVNSILVSPVVQGTSGSFKIDIKKGSSPTTASQSIFQSGQQPTLAYGASSGVTGLTDSNQNTVAAGQFIVVSVETTQAKLQEVHVFVAGDY